RPPEAPKELAWLFPELWPMKKAAERWTAKNPQRLIEILLRFGGFLTLTGPPCQTRWARALVRNGVDPRVALAAVLGLPAYDVHVKNGVAASEPTANTAPIPHPTSNPSPNMELTAQPNNGVPGSPSEDN